jgi:hypothetical protein
MNRTLQVLMAAAGLALLAAPAQALPHFAAPMNYASEVNPPPPPSSATGFTFVTLQGDDLIVDLNYSGLQGGTPSAAHIHCCIAPGASVGVAVGFPGFPTTLSGTYHHVFDLTDPTVYTAGFRNNFGGGTAAGSEAALIAGLNAGHAYSNIHNATYPGGEIRGLLVGVPEPATIALFGLGLITLPLVRRRKPQRA